MLQRKLETLLNVDSKSITKTLVIRLPSLISPN